MSRTSTVRPRTLVLGLAVLLLALAAASAWLGTRVLTTRDELKAARADVAAARDLLADGRLAPAQERLRAAAAAARRARQAADDPVWTVAGLVPVAGRPLDTARGLARSVDRLSEEVLPDLLTLIDALDPESLADGPVVDVAALRRAAEPLDAAAAAVEEEQAGVRDLSPSFVPAVAEARSDYLEELDGLASTSRTAADAAVLGSSLLGGDGPKRIFIAFQNTAEARATGGLMGAYATVVTDAGTVEVERIGSNTDLRPGPETTDGVPPEQVALYGLDLPWVLTANANVSAHFPFAVRNYARIYGANTGGTVDAVVAVDPEALARIMRVTGPVAVPPAGEVTAERVERFITREEYALVEDNEIRKELLVTLAKGVVDRLFLPTTDTSALLDVVVDAAKDGHILVGSLDPRQQQRLERYRISGALPAPDAGPFALAITNNPVGGKLDAYLHMRTDYTVVTCTPDERRVRLEVTVRNTAPPDGLPEYVTLRGDPRPEGAPPGQNRVRLQVYATAGARLAGATLDSKPIITLEAGAPPPQTIPNTDEQPIVGATERGLRLFTIPFEVPAGGGTRVLRLELTEPPTAADPEVRVQPLSIPPVARVDLAACTR